MSKTIIECKIVGQYEFNEDPIFFEGTQMLNEVAKLKFRQDIERRFEILKEDGDQDSFIHVKMVNKTEPSDETDKIIIERFMEYVAELPYSISGVRDDLIDIIKDVDKEFGTSKAKKYFNLEYLSRGV